MSIVNINDDSFSGDGTLDIDAALYMAQMHVKSGADIIDAGAESARTNRDAISVQEEIERLTPFIKAFHRTFGHTGPLLSVNTWRAEVLEAVLPLGVDILNDIGALPDNENARLCAKYGTSLLIMHSVGAPKIPHTTERYVDIIQALDDFFEQKIALATSVGLSHEHLILDPGIDFAKQRDENLRIYREMDRLHHFGRPVLLPVSRKTVIGDVLQIPDPSRRDAGTVASIVSGSLRGAHIFRTHNTKAAVQTLKMMDSLR